MIVVCSDYSENIFVCNTLCDTLENELLQKKECKLNRPSAVAIASNESVCVCDADGVKIFSKEFELTLFFNPNNQLNDYSSHIAASLSIIVITSGPNLVIFSWDGKFLDQHKLPGELSGVVICKNVIQVCNFETNEVFKLIL